MTRAVCHGGRFDGEDLFSLLPFFHVPGGSYESTGRTNKNGFIIYQWTPKP